MADPTTTAVPVTLPRLPCSISQRCDLLLRTEWSQDLPWEQLSALAQYVDAYRADKGAEIFRQGGLGHYLCLLVDGRVNVMMEDSTGTRKTLATIEAGKPFGEMSLIDGEPRSATAVAVEDSKVLVLTDKDFEVLSKEHPALGVNLLGKLARLMSQRLRQTSGLLVEYLEG